MTILKAALDGLKSVFSIGVGSGEAVYQPPPQFTYPTATNPKPDNPPPQTKHVMRYGAEPEVRPESGPTSVWYPGHEASNEAHAKFLIECRNYVRDHPVPEGQENSMNQYSHAGRPPIGGDHTKPAITNCCYEFFNRDYVSIGVPLFIHSTSPFEMDETHAFSAGFNANTLWEGMNDLFDRYGLDIDGDTKYAPYHFHFYIESTVSNADVAKAGYELIEYYTLSTTDDPKEFLAGLDEIMTEHGFPPKQEQEPDHGFQP